MMFHPLLATLINPLEYFILNTFHYYKTNLLVVLTYVFIAKKKRNLSLILKILLKYYLVAVENLI